MASDVLVWLTIAARSVSAFKDREVMVSNKPVFKHRMVVLPNRHCTGDSELLVVADTWAVTLSRVDRGPTAWLSWSNGLSSTPIVLLTSTAAQ